MKSVTASVLAHTEVAAGLHELWLATDLGRGARAGQFVMVRGGEGHDPLFNRPFSICRLRSDPPALSILFRPKGRGTHWLARRRPGDPVEVHGPQGRPFTIEEGARHLLLVAGGIGVAPLVLLAEEAVASGRAATLLLGAATAAELYPTSLLPAEVEVVIATDDGSRGRRGLVTDLLPEFVDWADAVFACGPRPMYATMAGFFRSHPTRKSVQIAWEEQMGCGMGVCLGCVVATRGGYQRACVDGPVFELREVAL